MRERPLATFINTLARRARARPVESERFTQRLPVLAAAATLVMLLAMTIGTTVALRSLMSAKSQGRFDEFAGNAAAVVSSEVSRSLTEISAVEGLFSATGNVSSNEFRSFAVSLTRGGSAVKTLGYARVIDSPVGASAPEVRVEYLYPTARGSVSVGSSLDTDHRFSPAMIKARETASAVATGPFEISSGGPVAFLVFFPVYGRSSADESLGLSGYAFGVYDVAEFLAKPLTRADIGSTSFRVLDMPPATVREIFPSSGGDSASAWGEGYRAHGDLTVAGRNWRLEFLSPHGYGLSPLEQQVWIIVMSAGLALTVVAAGSTYSLVASRRQVRLDLQLMTTQLSVILDAALEGIVVTDQAERVIWANGAFSKAFGVDTGKSLVGVSWAGLWERPGVEVGEQERFVARMKEISADPSLAITSEDIELKRPARRTLSLTSVPVADRAGTYLGRLWVYRDVTTERAADKAKSVFVSMVSHELRTPLTSVVGFLDLAIDEAGDDAPGKLNKYLGTARTNADRLQRLVRDILDLSSLEAGGIKLDFGKVNMAELVDDLVESFETDFRSHHQTAYIDVPTDLPLVRGDRGRVAQILTNLLSNAQRYTPPGGKVSVVARRRADHVELSVSDTGVGIAADDHRRIFERFVRLGANGHAPRTGGTGLGLAITKTLVELHGGTISVESSPGLGSTFTVRLQVECAGEAGT